jgi:hypothetical protein
MYERYMNMNLRGDEFNVESSTMRWMRGESGDFCSILTAEPIQCYLIMERNTHGNSWGGEVNGWDSELGES